MKDFCVEVMMFTLLAIDFGSPWLLTGLAGASIPVVIHLLSKRRFRETRWAAMKFLAEAARKHSRRLRWEQLLLLLIRCLAVGCLALAFSRPFFESAHSDPAGRAPRHLILVIDDSFSMSYATGPKTRLDRAIELARQFVEESRSGDAFSLLTTSASAESQFLEPTFRTDSMLAQLDRVRAAERPADVIGTFSQIENLLATKVQPERKELAVISDFQLRDWPTDVSPAQTRLRKTLERIDTQRVEFSLMDVGRQEASNATITAVEISPRPLLVGQTATIEVDVSIFGEWPEAGFVVELEVNGKTLGAQNLIDDSADRRRLAFEHQWSDPGQHKIVCRVREDPLSIDDTYYTVANVRNSIRVLLVEGRTSAPERDRSSYYLQNALSTVVHSSLAQSMFQVSVVDELGFSDLPLDEFHTIALCNLPVLPESSVVRMKEFLTRGGGLLICWGDLTQPAGWNSALERLNGGETPFKLLDSSARADRETEAWGFLTDDLTHPAVEVFQGNPGTGLDSAIIWERQDLLVSDQNGIVPVLRFDDGSPAIFEWRLDAGRVLFSRMSFDARSGSWAPLSGSFPPVAIRMFQHLSGSDRDERNTKVGEVLSGSWGSRQWVGGLKMSTPAGTTLELPTAPQAGSESATAWRFSETAVSGFYELSFGASGSGRELYAVNVDRSESELTPIDSKSLQQLYFPNGAGVRRSAQTGPRGDETLLPIENNSLIAGLLLAATALIVVEVVMAWKFLAGLICLGSFA
ncbi:MAG TPA: BatA domain-containing protein, partial [Planctomycetaceae bacterium]|nr:BatA domain-containing protein [Planctomycetaceae bacterium]